MKEKEQQSEQCSSTDALDPAPDIKRGADAKRGERHQLEWMHRSFPEQHPAVGEA